MNYIHSAMSFCPLMISSVLAYLSLLHALDPQTSKIRQI